MVPWLDPDLQNRLASASSCHVEEVRFFVFQHPAWVIINLLFWIGLHPFLRMFVYPQWELKPFIHGMEAMSATLIALQCVSLWTLYGRPQKISRSLHPLKAFALLPVIWLVNSLVLWLLLEFHLVQDPLLEPLYDSQLFIRTYPLSWTALGFLMSGVFEEIFFRAWLPDFLQRRWRKSTAILVSALFFAVAHGSLHTNAQAVIAYLLFGLSLSYVRNFHGLGAAIGVHLLNNILAYSSQVFSFNLFAHLAAQSLWQYLVLFLLASGIFLVGRDFVRLVDKGAEAP
jgi:membrane protease YdiL (CAAX protease family)